MVIEIVDHGKDEYVGWAFGVIKESYLEIEEFFIYPNYRHRENGIWLSNEVIKLSTTLGLSVRMLIPLVDAEDKYNLFVRLD